MPQKTSTTAIGALTAMTAIGALSFELMTGTGDAPTEAHLLPPGPFRAMDGRPGNMDGVQCQDWQLNAAIAARVIALASSRKNDILIDFEHQSLRSADNGKRVEAAGWIPRTLEWREGKGLYALNISWVGDTASLIVSKKYRYLSAIFLFDVLTGEVLEILSVGLTNTPGLDGLDALADLARKQSAISTEKEADMADQTQVTALTSERDGLKTQVAALTTERDGLSAKVAALTAERDAQKTKLDSLEQEKADAALASEKAKHAELLTAALSDGRLVPAQKPWAEKQSLAALTEYLDATKPLPITQTQAERKDGKDGNHGLDAEALAWCNRMGVTPDQYVEAKKSQS
ncbi:phage protease [Azospira sp. APE16]|uniref:phage protease n=1 Tax=Azospira sp. APE16 TaxID=3394231 RepID=UPI003A4DD5DC